MAVHSLVIRNNNQILALEGKPQHLAYRELF